MHDGRIVLAAIPYETFSEIELGPITLRTFGLMFALGVVVGVSVVARLGERIGVSRDDTVSLATKMVIAGVIGARITWVLTHLSSVDSPLDVIAVWEGGLQYSGGFLAALAIGWPTFRHWDRLTQGRMLDYATLGLTVGIILGRVGCYSVGEHLGGTTTFFLGTRYEGGTTREGPLLVGEVIHNTALYEGLHLIVLALVLFWVIKRGSTPGVAAGVFGIWYSLGRFGTDFLRSYDELVLGLTGAQWTCFFVVALALYILIRVRPRMAARLAEDQAGAADGEEGEQAAASREGTQPAEA
ncbi:MAG: prolipoprotein diacylglyceryl transferase [Actinomycetota bacterium]|nr:prolipoprotein diacylglyceryl transferase [Actinomycetota bacterium]